MKIILSGIGGFMGAELAKLANAGYRNSSLTAGVDPNAKGTYTVPVAPSFERLQEIPGAEEADCIIDFSHHSATGDLTAYAIEHNKPLIIATTGQTDDELQMIHNASEKIPVFFAANYSLGVALLIELARKTAEMMPDAEIEIVEMHHDRKLDAPSGTALAIANAIKEVRPDAELKTGRSGNSKRTPQEIGIHAVRMGNIVGVHEVLVGTQNQTITLKHEAHSRALFAEGALAAAEFLIGKTAGLYNMKNLIEG